MFSKSPRKILHFFLRGSGWCLAMAPNALALMLKTWDQFCAGFSHGLNKWLSSTEANQPLHNVSHAQQWGLVTCRC